MSVQILVVAGPDKGRSFELKEGTSKIVGRGESSTARLSDPAVSRVHLEISISDNTILVQDKGSSSGTFVNGSRIENCQIKAGQKVRIGDTMLQIGSDESEKTMMGAASSKEKARPLRDLVGSELGPFTLNEIVGVGNSGMLFKTTDPDKGDIAIKVLSPAYTSTEEQRQRFVRAMKTMLPIKGDNIVCLHKAGKNGPYCWVAMEYIEGENLSTLIERIGIEGMLDWKKVWRVAVDIAQALDTGFQHQIIHRNVTPRNIMRRAADETCLLGDFMLAKALQGTLAKQVTQPGELLGELAYMAPERTKADAEVDTRSDMYGLGATCYALLTGQAVAVGVSMPELIDSIRNEVPKLPKEYQLAVDDLFQGLVMKMLAKQPEDRFQTPRELLKELVRIGKYNSLSI